eukprot:GABW01004923.1.p1 GENE.GABW01004923.1~~GABW01004923.1.p1  ORF type:complete len:88 (-),score=30.52 GABW01004923.1:3-266(-)
MAFFLGSIFGKTKMANILSYVSVIVSVIITSVLTGFFYVDEPMPAIVSLWPALGCYRAIALIAGANADPLKKAFTLSEMPAEMTHST